MLYQVLLEWLESQFWGWFNWSPAVCCFCCPLFSTSEPATKQAQRQREKGPKVLSKALTCTMMTKCDKKMCSHKVRGHKLKKIQLKQFSRSCCWWYFLIQYFCWSSYSVYRTILVGIEPPVVPSRPWRAAMVPRRRSARDTSLGIQPEAGGLNL